MKSLQCDKIKLSRVIWPKQWRIRALIINRNAIHMKSSFSKEQGLALAHVFSQAIVNLSGSHDLQQRYAQAVEVTDMKAHLLKYPVEGDRVSQVKPLPGCPTFPDINGNIVGTFMTIQENLTI